LRLAMIASSGDSAHNAGNAREVPRASGRILALARAEVCSRLFRALGVYAIRANKKEAAGTPGTSGPHGRLHESGKCRRVVYREEPDLPRRPARMARATRASKAARDGLRPASRDPRRTYQAILRWMPPRFRRPTRWHAPARNRQRKAEVASGRLAGITRLQPPHFARAYGRECSHRFRSTPSHASARRPLSEDRNARNLRALNPGGDRFFPGFAEAVVRQRKNAVAEISLSPILTRHPGQASRASASRDP
jgi:hypothetical protein